MKELDEDKITELAMEYAKSRELFFRPYKESYLLACKNAFINAYAVGYYACKKEHDPDFEIPEPVKDVTQNPE